MSGSLKNGAATIPTVGTYTAKITDFGLAKLLETDSRLSLSGAVANDYTVRFENRLYQLDKPFYPGERGDKVVVEARLDGSMAIRFGDYYLKYHEIALRGEALGGSAPQTPRSLATLGPTPEGGKEDPVSSNATESSGVQAAGERSGRTSAQPYPPDGEAEDIKKGAHRPAADHPWRRGFRGKRKD